MRDIHFDASFMRDFNEASKNWSWASWHQMRAAQEAVAERLLEQVFGQAEDGAGLARDNQDEPGK